MKLWIILFVVLFALGVYTAWLYLNVSPITDSWIALVMAFGILCAIQ